MYALPWHHADLSTATPAPLSLAVGRQIAVGDRKWLQLQWESQLSASSSTPPTGYHFIVQEKWRWHKQSPAASGNDPDGLHTPIVPPSTAILRSADTASAAVAPPSLPATAPLPATTSSLSASSASAAAAAAPPLQPPPYARPTQSTQQRAVARFPLLTPPIEDDSATGGGVDHGRWRTVYCGRFPQCGVGWYPGGSLAMFRVAVVNEARTTGPWSDVLTVKFPAVPLPPPIVLVTHDTSAVVRRHRRWRRVVGRCCVVEPCAHVLESPGCSNALVVMLHCIMFFVARCVVCNFQTVLLPTVQQAVVVGPRRRGGGSRHQEGGTGA